MRADLVRTLNGILESVERGETAGGGVEIHGEDPVLATRFRVGEAAAVALAGCGGLAAECWRVRTGRQQKVSVEVSAAAASLLSFAFQRIEGADSPGIEERRGITDFYPTRDGRWVLVHGGFPHLHQGILDLLGVSSDDPVPTREVGEAIAEWTAQDLEDAIAEQRLCGAMVRSESEWSRHPQGRALANVPLVEVIRVGESPPEPFDPAGARPLSGVRVLDLTRVLAGPTCARTLAEHGAEVLKINSPKLPSVPFFVTDTGHGKRSAYLHLRDPADADRLRELVADADVFSQGYRGGALDRLGFDMQTLHELRPGLVYTSINCYGHEGPWADRAGWEQLAQTVTGIADENGDDMPRLLPAAATDYTTGYLAALGTLAALARRAAVGGSYAVRVSLSRTGMWLQGLGRTDAPGAGLSKEILDPLLTVSETPQGKLHHLRPVAALSETAPRWERPAVPLGTHDPIWEARP